ncbi:hypothetical protein ACO22_01161 [Paracoccidioides brasiliensis]|uniref:VWFA domain-containing protein n=1 Tax=Paracoccidioides brasiliensis TaxID=121759 RepID=A0A1D2JML5_PARBR|nr:hypothetical protein ACO22_01161 [Paracoccidioides brasiliensis]
MFKITRSEANRNLILLALVLVPIVLLFSILATALVCSEYWSLRRERRRLIPSGNSGHTRRNRSDAPCLASSSDSSSASTKRSESSDSDADIQQSCPTRLSSHAPTKATQQSPRQSLCALIFVPPFAVPRRHPSYAVRRTSQFSRVPQYSTLQTPRDRTRSCEPRDTEMHTPLDTSPPELEASDSSESRMEERGNERRRLGSSHTLRKVPSKGIFARVAQALDFNKQRQPSPGPVPGSFTTPDRPTRSYTAPSPIITQSQLGESNRCESTLVTAVVSPQQFGRTPPLTRTNLCITKHRNNVQTRFPCPLPITSANMHITMDAMKISAHQDLFTWAAVDISAKIANLDGDIDAQIGCEVPLDIMILVDNSASMPPTLLNGACNTVLHIASSMDILVDRLAIGCISADPEQNLQLLSPLSICNLDLIRRLLRSMQIFELPGDQLSRARTTKALQEASNLLLRYSSRGALRHVFVVTSSSSISLPDMSTNVSSRIRFHTVSPEPALGIRASTTMVGWHLSASFDDEEDDGGVQGLKDSLKQVMRHLRMGLDPGVLSNLSIRIAGGDGCYIQAILGQTKCKTLRPGEKWTILVKIKAISEALETSYDPNDGNENTAGHGDHPVQNRAKNDVDQMIDQLQGLFRSSTIALTESLFTVTLEHNHSALSSAAVIKLENKCEINRYLRSNSLFGEKVTRALRKDVQELYDEERTIEAMNLTINSMHLSHHLDGEDRTESAHGDDSLEGSSYPPDPMMYVSPRVALGSMNPFRNLLRGCDENCIHALPPDQNAHGGIPFVSRCG